MSVLLMLPSLFVSELRTSFQACCAMRCAMRLPRRQCRTQSPLAVCPVVGRRERLWGTGILLPQSFCGKTMQAVTERPIKNFNSLFFNSPESLPAANHWPKNLRTLDTRLPQATNNIFGSCRN